MKINEILPVALGVLTNPYVIAVAIFIIIYCSFVSYIVRYRKKPPKIKVAKQSKPAANPQEAGNASQEAANDSANE